FDRRHLDGSGLLATEYPDADSSRPPAYLEHGLHGTADDLLPEIAVVVGKDRRISRFVKPSQRGVVLVNYPGGIDVHQVEENRGSLRKRPRLLHDLLERRILKPLECDAAFQGFGSLLHLAQPEFLVG